MPLLTQDLPPPDDSPRPGSARLALPLLAVGEEVAGRYRIEACVARGGMGEVYEALDLQLQETVALKVLLPREEEEQAAAERFWREVQLGRQVAHPNVCRVFEAGVHRAPGRDAALPFFTMEFLRGETLEALLAREGRVSPGDALPLLRQMVAGLGAVHAADVVHCDLKTSNVLLVLDPQGHDALRVVLTDFGLARSPETSPETSGGVHAGEPIGTPAYMAPEQVEGGPVSPATDVYALGIVLYELLTGTRPFPVASPLATAMRRLRQPPPSPRRLVPGLERRWERALLRCLEREPARRFPSAHALLDALEAPARRTGWLLPSALAVAGLVFAGALALWA